MHSAADALNPYAAPSGAAEYQLPTDPGVGVWRDGKAIVVHVDAKFPPRCLKTNDPSELEHTQKITWSYMFDWWQRRNYFSYALASYLWKRNRLIRQIGIILMVLGLLLFIGSFLLARVDADYGTVAFFISLVSFVIGWNTVTRWGNYLKFVKANKSYLWLKGAGRPFIESLPQWPGLNR